MRDITERKVLEGRQELLGAVMAELAESLQISDEDGNLLRFDERERRLGTSQKTTAASTRSTGPPTSASVAVDGRPAAAADVPLYRALHGAGVDGAEVVTDDERLLHVTARPGLWRPTARASARSPLPWT